MAAAQQNYLWKTLVLFQHTYSFRENGLDTVKASEHVGLYTTLLFFLSKGLFMCCTVYLRDHHYSFTKHTLPVSLTRDSYEFECYYRSVDAFLWEHKCVHVCAGMLTCLWGGILLEEGEQLLLPIKLQQTIIVFGPNLVVPHPSINLISSGQLTWRMCCAVLPKHSP